MAYASAKDINDAQALIAWRVWLCQFCQNAWLAGLIHKRMKRTAR